MSVKIVIDASIEHMPENSVYEFNRCSYYQNILTCFGYSNDNPPVADLLRQLHGLSGEWLIVSPLHWQATHNDAMITAMGADLHLSDDESRAWFEAFAAFIQPEQMKLYYHDATTWLLQVQDHPIDGATLPLSHVLNQSMMPLLAQLDATLFWQRFITEAQMFFSGHALNRSRTMSYPINGIWIWGQGQLNVQTSIPISCDNDEGLKLAAILSTNINTYVSNNPFPKKDGAIVMLNDLNYIEPFKAAYMKQHTIHWYWNNIAYITKPTHWLYRFRSRFKHAN